MTEEAKTDTARDGPPVLGPGTDVHRTRRQRRPTGAPPPLPHPFAISTAAWLFLALAVLATAFLVTLHSPALRVDDRFSTWVLRLLAGLRTPWLTDIAIGFKNAGSGWGATVRWLPGGRPDDGVPALAAPAGLPVQPVLPGDRRPVDLRGALKTAPVRRADHRQLGRLLGPLAPGRRPHDLPGGHRVLPHRPRPSTQLREAGHRGPHRAVLPGSPVPGCRSPRGRAARRGARRGYPGHRVPLLYPERGVPGCLPARPDRPRRCDRPARRGDQAGRARPAWTDGGRNQAGRARVLGRLNPAAAAGRRRPGRVSVRQAVHQGPRASRPLVQAVADHPVRRPGGRVSLQDGAAPGHLRGLCPAPAAGHRRPHRAALRHRRDHPRARVPARHRVLPGRRGNRRGRRRRWPDRPGTRNDPQAVGRRDRPPGHQTRQPHGA